MHWRALVTGAGLLLCAGPPAHATDRAIWVWERVSYAMLSDRAAADATSEFLRAKKINRVYLYADAYKGRNILAETPESYARLIRRLREQGIGTYALLGSWHLHTERYVLPERHGDAAAMLRRVLEYNAGRAEPERFDGVNLDIEPHLLDEWNDRTRKQLLRDFLDLGALLMALKRDLRATVPIGPAIPFWLDGIPLDWRGVTKPVSEHVQDTYDYVALMDYRDRAEGGDGIIDNASSEMEYAKRRGKRLVIGLDVSPGEPKRVSFDHLREPDLERAVAETARAYEGSPAFGGFVIHHLEAYRRWLARTPPPGSP
jgi:hypothetical protein